MPTQPPWQQHIDDMRRQLARWLKTSSKTREPPADMLLLLDKLEQGGLLASQLIPGEAHPMRKQFHLTERGHQSLHAWMLSPVQHGREMLGSSPY